MAQQTCCVSSRPASRPVDRSLLRSSSQPRIGKRLGRIARRALTALLIVGATSFGVSPATALAHDHVPAMDESAHVDVTANSLPSRLTDDAMLGQWLRSIEMATAVCGPAQAMNDVENIDTEIELSAGPLAETNQVAAGGGGVHAIYPTTANQWQEYCKLKNLLAWGDQANQWASPLIQSIHQSATETVQSSDASPADQSRELVRGLSDLSCEEPIDIAPPADNLADEIAEFGGVETDVDDAKVNDASAGPKFSVAALVGGGPLVTNVEDAYLAYDLSPEDVIAMRMYPIDGPTGTGAPISYLGARRTAIYGPVPNFEGNGNWHQQVEPGIVVSTPGADADDRRVAVSQTEAESEAPEAEPQLPAAMVQSVGNAATWVVAAVQPDSEVRQMTSTLALSRQISQAAASGVQSADKVVGQIATKLAAVMPVRPQPLPFIGPVEQLVAEARLEAPRPVSDSLAAEPVESPTQMLQIELACKAALDVVKLQAARGEINEVASLDAVSTQDAPAAVPPVDDQPADELVRAQAVATACDLAAASLEKLAMSLRRAGDTLVRQAKAGSGSNRSLLR